MCFDKRVELLEAIIKEAKLDFEVFVDKWEGSQPGYFLLEQVWASYQFYIDAVLSNKMGCKDLVGKIEVCYCLGEDRLDTGIDKLHTNLKVS